MTVPRPFLDLLRRVQRIRGRGELPGHADRVRGMAAALAAEGAGAEAIAALAARVGAALVRRLVGLFEAERGAAPAPFAWLALGSEARREQPLPTDQDHALALASGDEAWAAALAERLRLDLEAAGLPPCPGGLTADRWRASLDAWCGRVAGWMEEPEPEGVLAAAALADARPVAGRLRVDPLRAALARAPGHPRFLRELARAALAFRPPPALLVRLGAARAELERDAAAPLVLVARLYGLAARSPARGSCDRLADAAGAGLLDGELAAAAAGAFRAVAGLRLRAGLRGASGPLDLAALRREERETVLSALGTVRRLQDRAAARFLG